MNRSLISFSDRRLKNSNPDAALAAPFDPMPLLSVLSCSRIRSVSAPSSRCQKTIDQGLGRHALSQCQPEVTSRDVSIAVPIMRIPMQEVELRQTPVELCLVDALGLTPTYRTIYDLSLRVRGLQGL